MTETAKKTSLLNSIKDAFWEEDPHKPAGAQKPPPAGPSVRNTPIPTYSPVALPMATLATPQDPDPAALAKLHGLLQTAVSPSYAAFTTQYEALKDVVTDDTVRFRAALKTSGCTIADLEQAVDTLLQRAATADKEFDTSFESNQASKLNVIKAEINTKNEALERLKNQVATLSAEINQSTEKLHGEGARFQGIQQGFKAALAQVVGELNAQKAHIASQKG